MNAAYNPWKARILVVLAAQIALLPISILKAEASEYNRHSRFVRSMGWPTWVRSQPLVTQSPPPPPVQVETVSRTIPAGVQLRTVYTEAERIVLAPDESLDLTLEVIEPITTWNGQDIIPAGSLVEGTIEPWQDGMRFFARQIIFPDVDREPIALAATSEVITETEEISRGTDVDAILRSAAIGAGASLLLQLLTGDRKANILTVLGGAALGAGAGWLIDGRQEVEVFVIDANEDLDITIEDDLVIPLTTFR